MRVWHTLFFDTEIRFLIKMVLILIIAPIKAKDGIISIIFIFETKLKKIAIKVLQLLRLSLKLV